jgi:hypothetical protein
MSTDNTTLADAATSRLAKKCQTLFHLTLDFRSTRIVGHRPYGVQLQSEE